MISVAFGIGLALAGYPWWFALPVLLLVATIEAQGRADRRRWREL